jgi:hypothetical protein
MYSETLEVWKYGSIRKHGKGDILSDGIAHQNKDILMKVLAETYRDKSLKVYGLDLPPIKELLPNALPAVKANEIRSDTMFRLQDDTILLLEYESKGNYENLLKYGHYAFRLSEREKKADAPYPEVRIVVIYTGGVESAPENLNIGDVKITTKQVFLSNFDGDKMYEALKEKVENKEPLTEEDMMRFQILPLTAKRNIQEEAERTIALAERISDGATQLAVLAGIVCAVDKFVNKDYLEKVLRRINMTQFGRLIEEEKLEYANEYAKKYGKNLAKEIAVGLFKKGMDILDVMEVTHFGKDELLDIQKSALAH